jgi:hypothetical protein
MRKAWKLVALLGLLVAGAVWGDNNVLNHGTYSSNAPTGLKVDGTTGNLAISEQYPAMDANFTFPTIITNVSLAPGAADSSLVLDTHRMRLGTLLIKCTPLNFPAGDSLAAIRIGVQVRTHLQGASDSSSTFAFYMYGRSDQGTASTANSQVDTSLAGQIQPNNNLAASANIAGSGEFTVAVAMNRLGPGGLAIPSYSRTFTYPNGIAIPLSSIFGRDLYSPYTSIRVRNLGNIGAANRSCAITVSLVGTPL